MTTCAHDQPTCSANMAQRLIGLFEAKRNCRHNRIRFAGEEASWKSGTGIACRMLLPSSLFLAPHQNWWDLLQALSIGRANAGTAAAATAAARAASGSPRSSRDRGSRDVAGAGGRSTRTRSVAAPGSPPSKAKAKAQVKAKTAGKGGAFSWIYGSEEKEEEEAEVAAT